MRIFLVSVLAAAALLQPLSAAERFTFAEYYEALLETDPQFPGKDLNARCEETAIYVARHYSRNDAWHGVVSQCFAQVYVTKQHRHGFRVAACAYFLEAQAHYERAHPQPDEVQALNRLKEEVARQIAGLDC
jgi:hypothetical protein